MIMIIIIIIVNKVTNAEHETSYQWHSQKFQSRGPHLSPPSDGNDFNHFKPTKLANFVQFKCMLILCLENWGAGPPWLRHC